MWHVIIARVRYNIYRLMSISPSIHPFIYFSLDMYVILYIYIYVYILRKQKILLIYLFLAVLSLLLCRFFSSSSKPWLLFVAGHRLLIAVASLVAEHGLYSMRASVVLVHRLSCSLAHGIFLDQGQNLCFMHWQAGSLPLSHQDCPIDIYIYREREILRSLGMYI